MDFTFLAVMYFFVVVIIVLSFLLVKEKQLMYRLFDERDVLKEDLDALKLEKARRDQGGIQFEEESFTQRMEEPEYEEEPLPIVEEAPKPRKHLESVFAENGSTERTHFRSRERMIDKEVADREPMRKEPVRNDVPERTEEEEPFIVLNNKTFSRYEDELFRREES
ncbi:hypothetical protein [Enterococcus sp. BWR-S5]|uniref:hypothetical protein n=1 Tax=Enterococcus sp. BWR-S5 TaxID=2787714 RepID=UPI0019209876|nr:hypothetical protein [Enterococcus sp. BWR-S5]MBL1223577.1 hypothetical protein [Enterococcus sp. BWR-S5]